MESMGFRHFRQTSILSKLKNSPWITRIVRVSDFGRDSIESQEPALILCNSEESKTENN